MTISNFLHAISHKAKNPLLTSLFIVLLAHSAWAVDTPNKNGFDLSNSTIATHDIFQGGPPRDGIPAINNPKFVAVDEVDFLRDDDIVIGILSPDKKQARAYPTRILIWHEIVNDSMAGHDFAVTYCPLCGTSMVFDRLVDGQTRQFGVSGLLYNSDVLLYDKETESLWSQLGMKAISGSAVGSTLTWLPSIHTTWAAWQKQYPDSQVLSTDTGYQRDYRVNAYASYFSNDDVMFPVTKNRDDFSNKTWVIGVIINNQARAYPVHLFDHVNKLQDTVGDKKINIHYTKKSRHHVITNQDGKPIPSVLVFWFAWQAFYPNTEVWDGSS